jgi:hypothetical protein
MSPLLVPDDSAKIVAPHSSFSTEIHTSLSFPRVNLSDANRLIGLGNRRSGLEPCAFSIKLGSKAALAPLKVYLARNLSFLRLNRRGPWPVQRVQKSF